MIDDSMRLKSDNFHILNSTEPQIVDILKHRFENDTPQYYVRWQGYGMIDFSWEKEDEIDNLDLLKKYKETHKVELLPKKPVKRNVNENKGYENEKYQIVDATRYGGTVLYHIKDSSGVLHKIKSEDAKRNFPFEVIKFLEERINFETNK